MQPLPAWLEPFSQPVREAVLQALALPGEKVACFDADNTIWSEDLGEALFRWLAAGSLLPGVEAGRDPFDLWEEYEERVRKNRTAGYAWAVQVMAGLQETDVRQWCRQMAIAWPNYRPDMVGLIKGLSASSFQVWIVSASNHWVVEAAAPLVGVMPSRVLGIRTKVVGGKLTDTLIHPVTCNSGKAEAIQKHVGYAPDIAAGDSVGDLEMLQGARFPLVIGRHDRASAELLRIAAERHWATHLF